MVCFAAAKAAAVKQKEVEARSCCRDTKEYRRDHAITLHLLLVALLILELTLTATVGEARDATNTEVGKGLKIRLGYPAGARVRDSDMHGMPANAEDGVVAISLRLELKGSVCDEGCWLRPRTAMQAEEERSDMNTIGKLGYVLSLAQASLPCVHQNSEISGWDLNPNIVTAWDVVSDSSAHEMGVESGMGDQGAAHQNRGEGWTPVDVEIDLEYYGASYPTVEGMHFVHVTLQGPNEKTIPLGGLDGVASTSGHAIYSGWDPDLGWVGTPGRQVLHNESTVIWTPPAKKLSTLLLYHHLGMGDHLVCAGLVRRLAADYKLVLVVVHAPYLGSALNPKP